MQSNTYTLEITVPEEAIDQLGHVNNVQYLQWIQDVAEAHWLHATTEDIQKEYVWVALEHTIKYHNQSFKGEKLTLKTWVDSFEGVRSIRHVEIIRNSDQKKLVSSITQWCLLHMPEGRPMRIPALISDLF